MANAFDSINALLAYKDGKIAEFKERAENAELAVRALKHDVKELLEEALSIDGAQHKQWYLWRIAEALKLEIPDDLADKGVTP